MALFSLSFLLLISSVFWMGAQSLVTFNNSNNMYGCIGGPGDSTAQLISLGKKNTQAECVQAFQSNSLNFRSFVYYPTAFPDDEWRHYCYGRSDTWWSPVPQLHVVSGQINNFEQCRSDLECELNGKCVQSHCQCKAMWTGNFCQYVHQKPGAKNLGYQRARYSQWGGSAIYDAANDEWNLFAAEMYGHCGINACCDSNSQIVRAVSSTGAGGPYIYKDVAVDYFSHEPMIIYSKTDGLYLLYHWGAGDKNADPVGGCTDGYTNGPPPNRTHRSTGGDDDTYISYSASLNGPWKMMEIPDDPGDELCLSNPNILANNDSVLMAWSYRSSWDQGSCIELVMCDKWNKNCKFPENRPGKCAGLWPTQLADKSSAEDPFMWLDSTDNTWHILMHGMTDDDYLPDGNPWLPAAQGRHAYSTDGVNFVLSPHYSYNSTICYSDGECILYARRERPHLIFDPSSGEPTHLTNGMQYNNLTVYDYTFHYAAPLYTNADLCNEGQNEYCQ